MNTANNHIPQQRVKRIILLIVIPALLCIGGLYFYLQGGRYAETDNAYVKAEKIPISPEVSGSIVEVYVKDNQAIKTNDPLFRIDDAALVIAVDNARAKLTQTYSEIASLKASYQVKLAQIQLEKANLHYAKTEQQRQTDLSKIDYTSKAEEASTAHNTEISQQKIALLEKELEQIEAAGGNSNTPVEKHPGYIAAKTLLEQSELNLSRAIVKSPRNGIVSKPPKAGQFANAGSISTMIVANDAVWIEANLTESDTTYVQSGQPVSIHIDAYPQTQWQGEVESISPATGSEFSIIPAQNATGNWVKVTQRITVRIKVITQDNQPALRAGLSAIIKIDTGHKRTLAELFQSL